ncbi:hypothetical protein [Nonomuraea sp. SBT364]|uniref:hypothetical protein n=1 Tax=Nonomuraea sp. SBT364 TaxID=1580530 RepID=UPI00066D9180|nr:hypothetical protein [Nonomuraea sp. SBT364]
MTAIAGCSSGEPPAQSPAKAAQPSASTAPQAGKLRTALLPAPKGMRVAYGPEIGRFGTLTSVKEGLAAVRQTKLDRPECAGATQLDPAKPEIAGAPAAVIAFSSPRGSITQAVVELPRGAFPVALPKQCAAYHADVQGTKVTYRTQNLSMPRQGDESRAYLTTASGGDRNAQIGSIVIRRGNVVMSLMVVGQKVKRAGLMELGRLADHNLSRLAA